MEIKLDSKVGEIVKTNFKTAQIFDKNNIDFCCGGGISLEEACKKSNTNINELIPELEALVTLNDPDSKYFNSLELDELSDYIVKRHHSYVRENITFLLQKLQKLCDVHGQNHPELFEIKDLFEGAAENLSNHMVKEETILFPLIKVLVANKNNSANIENQAGKLNETINSLDEEHQTEGVRFEKISTLTNNYTCPPDGCTTYQITFQTLKDFEQDLHRHIHLENNILFVKAQALEKELTKYV